jgi:hypothetical protein
MMNRKVTNNRIPELRQFLPYYKQFHEHKKMLHVQKQQTCELLPLA